LTEDPTPIVGLGFAGVVLPDGWILCTIAGGGHDGVKLWALHPPRRFQVVADGDVYVRHGNAAVWVADGHEYDPAAEVEAEQLALG